MKRFGATSRVPELLNQDALGDKFPHRIWQPLDPYRLAGGWRIEDATDFPAAEIIAQEFGFAITRLSATGCVASKGKILIPLLKDYLNNMESSLVENLRGQARLTAITGLCTTVAFTLRTRNNT